MLTANCHLTLLLILMPFPPNIPTRAWSIVLALDRRLVLPNSNHQSNHEMPTRNTLCKRLILHLLVSAGHLCDLQDGFAVRS